MAVSSTFNPGNGVLTTTGDNLDNTITTSRDATGSILINAGAVPIQGGTATVTNTGLIQAFGQDGNDTISLDETNGALPSAKMFGGLGNDTVIGGSGADQLLGEAGNDILNGAGGADAMTGGAGNDAYFVDNISDQAIENPGEGNDTVFSTVDFRLSANIDNLILQGGADLQAYGNSAVNALFGNAGSNILDGGAGADAMTGGAGNDAYFVDNISDQTIENPGEGNDTVFSTVDFRLSANVDNLILQGGADLQAYGNSAVNALFGNAGSNILDGGAGADAMTGGAGNDAYFVDNAGDVVVEDSGEGNDTVFSSAHFALSANVENLVLQGGADLQGYGNDLANAFFGNTGNNLLDGGAGADSMSGGAGNDIYFVDNAGDAVNESAGQGNDTVFSSAHFALSANVENLVLQGGADLQGYGNGLANAIFGNSRQQPHRWRRRRRLHERGCWQRHLFRRQYRRPGDRERRPRQRYGLSSIDYGTTANVGEPGAPRRRRPAGLRQRPGERDLRQYRQQPHRWRRRQRHRDRWTRRRRRPPRRR